MALAENLAGGAGALLARLRAFCFPGDEDPARFVSAIRAKEQGGLA